MIILNKQSLERIYSKFLKLNSNSGLMAKHHDSSQGKVIIAPPGSGKSFFVKNQFNRDIFIKNKNKNQNNIQNNIENNIENNRSNIDYIWFDMDSVFWQLNLNWQENEADEVQFKRTYERADYLIEQCIRLGFNLIGCLYYSYKPDAIALLPKKKHLKYLKTRLDLKNRKHIIKLVEDDLQFKKQKYDIPTFSSIIEAVNYLESN